MGTLRVAGTGRSSDGATVTWSLAEGRRGRRWREAVVRDGTVVHSLLLELDPGGRFSHLELTTSEGLLTLHPEGDGTIHGNTVTAAGVTHVRGLSWGSDDVIVVEHSIICQAVAGSWQLARGLDGLGVVKVEQDLSLTIEHTGSWTADEDGGELPVLEDPHMWPLEED